MSLQELQSTWNQLGEADPMWAVLMVPDRRGNRSDPCEFYQTGFNDVSHFLYMVRNLEFPLRRSRALDFGCGVGRLTQGLACYFDEVDGVDIAPAMVRQARNYNPYGDRCRFHVNPRNDLSLFPDNHFDFILSMIVLQHMRPEYAKAYVAEFLRVLAPGGMLLFQQPSHYVPQVIDDNYVPPATRIWRSVRASLGCPYVPDAFDLQVPDHTLGDISITTPKFDWLEPILDWREPHLRIDAGKQGTAGLAGAEPPAGSPSIPSAELHTISRADMVRHLKHSGGRVLRIAHKVDTGLHYPSYRYYVTK
jgi:SAM-dependent methyltransferase